MTLKIVSVKIEEELLEQIDIAAKQLGLYRSELIRAALTAYIEIHRKTPQKNK